VILQRTALQRRWREDWSCRRRVQDWTQHSDSGVQSVADSISQDACMHPGGYARAHMHGPCSFDTALASRYQTQTPSHKPPKLCSTPAVASRAIHNTGTSSAILCQQTSAPSTSKFISDICTHYHIRKVQSFVITISTSRGQQQNHAPWSRLLRRSAVNVKLHFASTIGVAIWKSSPYRCCAVYLPSQSTR
jgi:hypothetical protein